MDIYLSNKLFNQAANDGKQVEKQETRNQREKPLCKRNKKQPFKLDVKSGLDTQILIWDYLTASCMCHFQEDHLLIILIHYLEQQNGSCT